MRNEIIIPIINDEYKVIVCWGDAKQVEKVLKSWGHDRNDTMSQLTDRRGVCFYSKFCHPVIALPRKPKTPDEIATLCHEAVHAVFNVFDKIDERSYDEVFAHSVGAVVRNTLRSIKKARKLKVVKSGK